MGIATLRRYHDGADAGGGLPDDFPGRDALADADLDTVAAVRGVADAGTLTDVDGVGEATAEKIRDALKEA